MRISPSGGSRWHLGRRPLAVGASALLLLGLLAPATSASASTPQPCSGSWAAASPGIAGATTYSKGEFVAQDQVLDDHGAKTSLPSLPVADTSTQPAGSYVYPGLADQTRYLNNASDLREVRLRLEGDELAVRIELGTLTAADTTVVALGLDTDGVHTGTMTWPHEAGLRTAGTDTVLDLWGTGADLVRRDGSRLALTGACADVSANVLEVRVPLAALGRTSDRWRVHAAAGLWDAATQAFLPVLPAATETLPGGADSATAERAFDLAFTHEGGPAPGTPAVVGLTWFDEQQAAALASGDLTSAVAEVDLALLRGRAERPWRTRTGLYEAVYRSSTTLGPDHEGWQRLGPLQGRYQPYTVYVPSSIGKGPLGLFEFFHGVTRNHTHLIGGPNERVQLGDRLGLLLVHTLGRGGSGGAPSAAFAIPQGYQHAGLLDGLEVLHDVQSRFSVDRARQYVGGYSLGGIATRELLGFYPDTWAGAVIWAGTKPDGSDAWLRSTRHVPTLLIHSPADEVVGYAYSKDTANALKAYGYQYQLNSHPPDHEHQAVTDDYHQPADWFASLRAPRDPARVTFTRAPRAVDDAALGIRPDKAYWVSGVSTTAAVGSVDLVSYALHGEDPGLDQFGPVVHTGPPDPYYAEGQLYRRPGRTYPVANRLGGRLTAIDSAVVDSARTRLDLTRPLRLTVTTDRTSTLGLTGCPGTPHVTGTAGVTRTGTTVRVRFPRAGSYDVVLTCERAAGVGRPALPRPEAAAAGRSLPTTGGVGAAGMASLLAAVACAAMRLRDRSWRGTTPSTWP